MKKIFPELAIVYAKEKINEIVDGGCLGTIVFVYGNDAYEVEFVDEHYQTIDLCTVQGNQIQGELPG
ncbi:MAG: DUF4926 domain-containing protein [Thermoclostridium sp.]|nr:DUF4926 domain-containing protein [Thermoclostridium sp.]